jgi:hypothetical protein
LLTMHFSGTELFGTYTSSVFDDIRDFAQIVFHRCSLSWQNYNVLYLHFHSCNLLLRTTGEDISGYLRALR